MNSNKKGIVPIFFSCDNNYAPYLSVALVSAVKNSSSDRNYVATILHDGLCEDNINKLKAIETDNFKIQFVLMEKGLEKITNRLSNCLRCEYFTLTIYFRLFIATMFPEYDKGIYIDSDVVITSDIAELYDYDLGENYIGACNDLSVINVPVFTEYMRKHVGIDKTRYINSGVLLLNLKKMRNNNFDEHFINLLSKYHFDSVAPDQDYINAICEDKILYLPSSWNTMPNTIFEKDENAKLIHYNLFSKPWCADEVQYGDVFWEYAEKSVYYKNILQIKSEFNAEKAEAERKCLENMLKRAAEISMSDITFKKIAASGERIKLW